MPDSYIPRGQNAAMMWMKTFAAGISANPERYQLTVEDATTIQSAVDAFVLALVRVLDPQTATRGAVATKNDARDAAERVCRPFAGIIKANTNISDSDKIDIGVRPLNRA